MPKAARSPDLLATRFVVLIGKLFAAEARSAKWKPECRRRLRARYSTRVLGIIERMLVEHLPGVVPSSLLGKALQYLSGQWPKLVRYVENGTLPISNNLCENAIRPFVVGRKGWLFSDTVAGAQASANLYSLVETCKANGIDPYRYLVWLFANLPHASTADSYAALLPGRHHTITNRLASHRVRFAAVNDGHARPAIAILLLLYPLPIRRDTDSLGIPTNHHGEQIIQPIRCKNLDRVIRK